MFAPNDDQQLLIDSARRFTQKHYADDRLGQMGESPLNTALWAEMAEAGWLMLRFPKPMAVCSPRASRAWAIASACSRCWAKAWWSNRCSRAPSSPAA